LPDVGQISCTFASAFCPLGRAVGRLNFLKIGWVLLLPEAGMLSGMDRSKPTFPDLPGPSFSLTETSTFVYRAEGHHADGRSVSHALDQAFERQREVVLADFASDLF
jgi:hypothetical protein